MPYLSEAQRRWAHTKKGTEALGGASKVAEWDAASKGKKLPERVKNLARGTDLVPATDIYKLHVGEAVIPAKENIMATEEQRAALTQQRGRQASRIKDPGERRRYIAESANIDKNYEGMADRTSAMEGVLDKRELLGDYKKGTKNVPKTGAYKLHKGEAVVPADENKMKERMDGAAKKAMSKLGGKKKAKKAHLRIQQADNGGFHVQHDGMEGAEPASHVFADLKGLLGHVQGHYGEEQAEMKAGSE